MEGTLPRIVVRMFNLELKIAMLVKIKFEVMSRFSMTVWRVVGPIALARGGVKDQAWLAADLLPRISIPSSGALAETLLAVSF